MNVMNQMFFAAYEVQVLTNFYFMGTYLLSLKFYKLFHFHPFNKIYFIICSDERGKVHLLISDRATPSAFVSSLVRNEYHDLNFMLIRR